MRVKSEDIIKRNEKINIMYDAGKTIKEVAKAFNLSITTVGKYIENPRPAGHTVEMEKDKIIEMNRLYNSGAIMKDLSQKYNVSISTIVRYIWKPRKRGSRRKIMSSSYKLQEELKVRG